jgi:hypothetical protein
LQGVYAVCQQQRLVDECLAGTSSLVAACGKNTHCICTRLKTLLSCYEYCRDDLIFYENGRSANIPRLRHACLNANVSSKSTRTTSSTPSPTSTMTDLLVLPLTPVVVQTSIQLTAPLVASQTSDTPATPTLLTSSVQGEPTVLTTASITSIATDTNQRRDEASSMTHATASLTPHGESKQPIIAEQSKDIPLYLLPIITPNTFHFIAFTENTSESTAESSKSIANQNASNITQLTTNPASTAFSTSEASDLPKHTIENSADRVIRASMFWICFLCMAVYPFGLDYF